MMLFYFIFLSLLLRATEAETEHEQGRGRERRRQNPKQAPGSELSTEPKVGLESANNEIMT